VNAGEELAVARRRRAPRLQDRVQLLELAEADCRGHVVEAVVVAKPRMLEPATAVGAALVGERLEEPPFVLVAGDDDPALAGRHLLVRIEREDGRPAVRADLPPLVARSERLARVLDQCEL